MPIVMQQPEQRANNWDHSFRAGVLGVFVVAIAAIGGAFYLHGKRVREQQALYAQYLAMNAWRPPVQAAYKKLCDRLDDLSKFDPVKEEHPAKLDAAMDQVRRAEQDMRSVAVSPVYPGTAIKPQLDILIASYQARYTIARFVWTWYKDDYSHVCYYLQIPSDQLAMVSESELEATTRKAWDNSSPPRRPPPGRDTRDVLRERYMIRSPWAGGTDQRRVLDKLVNEDVIPNGLDLEYAKTLK